MWMEAKNVICEKCGSDMGESIEVEELTYSLTFYDECPECGWKVKR